MSAGDRHLLLEWPVLLLGVGPWAAGPRFSLCFPSCVLSPGEGWGLGDKGDSRAALMGQWVPVPHRGDIPVRAVPELTEHAPLPPVVCGGRGAEAPHPRGPVDSPLRGFASGPCPISPCAPGVHAGWPSVWAVPPAVHPVQPWLSCPSSLAAGPCGGTGASPGSMFDPRSHGHARCVKCRRMLLFDNLRATV